MKKLLTVILVIILLGAAIGGFLIYRHTSTTIGRDAAIEAALADAGLTRSGVYDIDVEPFLYETRRIKLIGYDENKEFMALFACKL